MPAPQRKPEVDHAIAIMIGGGRPKPSAGMGAHMGDGSDGESTAKEHAAQEILDAIKQGDAAALSDALSTHYALCDNDDEPDQDDAGDAHGAEE